jgi:hypothetical protein
MTKTKQKLPKTAPTKGKAEKSVPVSMSKVENALDCSKPPTTPEAARAADKYDVIKKKLLQLRRTLMQSSKNEFVELLEGGV